jgi:peptidoglycan/LPS O-acetylase OafA/YrhL
MKANKVYFPNLNGVRFIAAFLVIIHHIEQFKSLFYVPSLWNKSSFIDLAGEHGVVLFFVLSGFLITYLLIHEGFSTGGIHIKNFYVRRVLRIWPLYFVIIILGFLILPHITWFKIPGVNTENIYTHFWVKLFMFIFFLPNIVTVFGVIPYTSHSWSIGTEEQFYLVWPLIVKYFKKFRILLVMSVLFFYHFFGFLIKNFLTDFSYYSVLFSYWNNFTINCMAIGAIFALALFHKKYLNYLMHPFSFFCTLIITTFLIIKGHHFTFFHKDIFSILFGILILNFSSNHLLRNVLEKRTLIYFGDISYGLYMYHPLCIGIVMISSNYFNFKTDLFYYSASIFLTILVAHFSYKYFETPFLKIKRKYVK